MGKSKLLGARRANVEKTDKVVNLQRKINNMVTTDIPKPTENTELSLAKDKLVK